MDIIVACPGRLLDLMNEKALSLRGIDTLVLDEADQMLDMGFLPDIRRIIRSLPKKSPEPGLLCDHAKDD
ncbi:MAG: DEAD/DEAH box helicase [Desulfobacter postgatei]|uniref:DEAD/DEAH box helicase n=1 Tax=Desulfobacter postgatei TaxID=2293 RepID=UPI0023F20BCF|nr:DEAD/DEAH box helicase [Desulfobacter postgatei]MDD4273007.1 DEAD/DEAH box helicase [Desulfobacter postgatei]